MTCIAFHNGVLSADRCVLTTIDSLSYVTEVRKLYIGSQNKAAFAFGSTMFEEDVMQRYSDALEEALANPAFNPTSLIPIKQSEHFMSFVDKSISQSNIEGKPVLPVQCLMMTKKHLIHFDRNEIELLYDKVPQSKGSGWIMFVAGTILGHPLADIYENMSKLEDYMVTSVFDQLDRSQLDDVIHPPVETNPSEIKE